MGFVLNGMITVALSIVGFFMAATVLELVIGVEDIFLSSIAVVIAALLIVIINQLARINDKLRKAALK